MQQNVLDVCHETKGANYTVNIFAILLCTLMPYFLLTARASCFYKHLGTIREYSARGFVLLSASRSLEPFRKHLHPLSVNYIKKQNCYVQNSV